MSAFALLVIVHGLAATVWTAGHLVLDLGVLPRALRQRSAAVIRDFEETFEPLGLTALAIQVLTGLAMGWIYLPGFQGLLSPANPIGMLVGIKLLLLAATAALALHARLGGWAERGRIQAMQRMGAPPRRSSWPGAQKSSNCAACCSATDGASLTTTNPTRLSMRILHWQNGP